MTISGDGFEKLKSNEKSMVLPLPHILELSPAKNSIVKVVFVQYRVIKVFDNYSPGTG